MTKQAKNHNFYNQGLEVLMEKLLWGVGGLGRKLSIPKGSK